MASEDRPRVLIDTNVFFSALLTPGGNPSRVITAALTGAIVAVVSFDVLVELARNIGRKAPARLLDLGRLLESVPLETIARPEAAEVEPWVRAGLGGDAQIVAAAILAEVAWLCTGDKWPQPTLRALEEEGILVRSPVQLIAALGLDS